MIKQGVEDIQRLNPTWTHRLYDDAAIEEFVRSVYGNDILSVYRSILPAYGAARADLFRYLCLYHHGGVYIDIKSSLRVPLSDILREDDDYLLGQWDQGIDSPYKGWGIHRDIIFVPGGEYIQWFLACRPKHPFLGNVIEQVIRNIKNYSPFTTGVGRIGVLRLTGPIAYTKAIHHIIKLHHCRKILMGSGDICYSVFDSHSATDFHQSIDKHHYTRNRSPITKISAPRLFIWKAVDLIKPHIHLSEIRSKK